MVSFGPPGPYDYSSRDACSLASSRLSLLLALEVALSRRAATAGVGSPRADPADEHREPVMGRTAHPRRTAQARFCGRPIECCQVYDQATRATQTGMAHLSA